jgi:hypothetical protein
MKLKGILLSSVLSLGVVGSAFANDSKYHLLDSSAFGDFDFGAPVVPSSSSAGAKPVGAIIYDASVNEFKGLDSSGSWDTMTVNPNINVASSTSGTERMERLNVDTICTTSPCTITSQSGSWASSITRNSAGNYTINVATAFSIVPTCVCNAWNATSADVCWAQTNSSTTSAIVIQTVNPASEVNEDNRFNVICTGAK